MIGQRKKDKKEVIAHSKKKWEMDFEEENEEKGAADLGNIEAIPKDENSSDDDDKLKKKKQKDTPKNIQDILNQDNVEIEKRKKENKNDKKIEWLSDEDKDLININTDSEEEEKNKPNPAMMMIPLQQEEAVLKQQPSLEPKKNTGPIAISNQDRDQRTIFVWNLSFDLTDQQIEKHFKKFGRIINVDVPRNEGVPVNKGRAFIEFETVLEAQNALQLHNTMFKSREIKVSIGLSEVIKDLAANEKKFHHLKGERQIKYNTGGGKNYQDYKSDSRSKSRSRSRSKSLSSSYDSRNYHKKKNSKKDKKNKKKSSSSGSSYSSSSYSDSRDRSSSSSRSYSRSYSSHSSDKKKKTKR